MLREFQKFPVVNAKEVTFWHIGSMKALKSELAKAVLKDPVASRQLRMCIHSARLELAGAGRAEESPVIEFRDPHGGTLRLRVVRVPKGGAS